MGQHSDIDHSGLTGVPAAGIPATILDAKGDIIAASAADTAAKVTVGANGSFLRAASGQSAGLEWQLNNFGASTAPGTGDDSGDGYSVGSRWIDTTADKEYVCLDASLGAAVWTETTGAGGSGDVATDAIWDAAGDLAVGSGADTAARLAVGSNGDVLTVVTGAPAWAAPSGGSGAYEFIDEEILGSDQASIVITAIPNTYRKLVIEIMARCSQASEVQALNMQVGDGSLDTGSNYGYHRAFTGTGATSAGSDSTTFMSVGMVSGANSTSGSFAYTTVEIPWYAVTTFRRTVLARSGHAPFPDKYENTMVGVWKNTADEIERISIASDAGNLVTGSRMAIYGVT